MRIALLFIALIILVPFASAAVFPRQRWAVCTAGQIKCSGPYVLGCAYGRWRPVQMCTRSQICDKDKGCVSKFSPRNVVLGRAPYAPTLERPFWQ